MIVFIENIVKVCYDGRRMVFILFNKCLCIDVYAVFAGDGCSRYISWLAMIDVHRIVPISVKNDDKDIFLVW